jgi:hypothetical protein
MNKNEIICSNLDEELLENIESNKIDLSKLEINNSVLPIKVYTLFENTFEEFNEEIKNIFKNIIELLLFYKLTLKQVESTIYSKFIYMKKFFKWCFKNNYKFYESIQIGIRTYEHYTFFLKESIRLGHHSSKTASNKQRIAMDLLESIHNVENNLLSSSIIKIYGIDNKKIKTMTSNTKKRTEFINFCLDFFKITSDFLINNKKYPLKFKSGEYQRWIFPQKSLAGLDKGRTCVSISFEEGRLFSIDEIMKHQKSPDLFRAKKSYNHALSNLINANKDYYHQYRLKLGELSLKSYYLFFINTVGLNEVQATNLIWGKEFETIKSKQKFRILKARAGNKIVEFEIQNKLIGYFYKFLELRKYLLKEKEFKYLFFSLNKDNEPFLSKYKFHVSYTSNCVKELKRNIYRNLTQICSRESRVNFTHDIAKKHGVIAGALMSQSLIDTFLNSYISETEKTTEKEFENYFKNFNNGLLSYSNKSINISVGHCDNLNNPISKFKLNSINTNCKQQEGCLFCENYSVHVDDEDIRKIFSLKYVIEESKYISKNEEHFISVYGLVLDQIDNIINQIITKFPNKKEFVTRIENEVFKYEKLSPYWDMKLSMLYDVGLLR